MTFAASPPLDDISLQALADARPQAWCYSTPSYGTDASLTRHLHIQRDAPWADMIDEFQAPLRKGWDPEDPWLERDANLLVTTPDAISPPHADEHHNLLVQLEGKKRITVCSPGSREHARAIVGGWPHLRTGTIPAGAMTVDLEAGQALYIPPFAVHQVHSLTRTVAMTCGWRTASSDHAIETYAAYATLQRLHIPVHAVGSGRDSLVISAARAARRAEAVRRGTLRRLRTART